MTGTELQKKIPNENHIIPMKEFVSLNSDETNAKLFSLFFVGKKEEIISDDGENDDSIPEEQVHIPQKNEINKYYLSDFTLKSQKEASELVSKKHARYSGRDHSADFFVHDEKTRKLIPFRKNDYLMYDGGHFTFDGKDYIYYDNNGIEKWRASYLDDKKGKYLDDKKNT